MNSDSSLVDAPPLDEEVSAQVDAALREGALIVDELGKILWCNEAASRIVGVPRELMTGQAALGDKWLGVRLDGSVVPRHEHPALRAMATGEPVLNSIMGVRILDFSEVWLRISSRPSTLRGETIAVTVFTDITNEITRRREFDDAMNEIRRTLIQPDMPSSGPAYFTARHRSAGPSRLIGGDFYGAHQHDANRFGFFIGDVCGHGVEAAGLSALARHTMRSAGSLLNDPNEVLKHLHDVVAAEQPDTYLTAIYGYIDTGEQNTVRLSSGGHPPPVLIGQNSVRSLDEVGPIVGMVPNRERPVMEFEVEYGDQLLLYTDGLTSTRGNEVEATDVLRTLPSNLLTDVLADVVIGMADQPGQPDPDDDATILAIGFH